MALTSFSVRLKSECAVKLFSFFLSRQNEVRLSFAAAPRCQKVLDFGQHWPDPFYGSAQLTEYMTLGICNAEPIHDLMVVLHCQVHQRLIEGVERILENADIAGLLRLLPSASGTETLSGNGP